MADQDQSIEPGNENDPHRRVVPFLQGVTSDETRPCDGCGRPIHAGQHYLRLAVLFDTAGMENVRLLSVPEVLWSGIFDDPACAADALRAAAETDELFTDVFRR